MICVQGLKKSFGNELIWQDVSLDIEEGETIVILGQSGTGKSVLLKHLNALLLPDEGCVMVDGKDICSAKYVELRKLRQKFGVLFQSAALFDSISSFENIAFPLRYFTDMDEDEIHHTVEESLERVNLGGLGHRKVSELSGGMRKRVGLARAIILRPKYILYDEPTAGLDPVMANEIDDLIISMSDQLDISSIVVTHNMHSVFKIADKIAFLNNQTLCWFGTLDDLYTTDYEPLVRFMKASEYHLEK